MTAILFADSNVLIEALLVPKSAAYVIAELVARGVFDLATCQLCVEDTEDAIIAKLQSQPDVLEQAIISWEKFKLDTRLQILQNPEATTVNEICDQYLAIMRHKADIPVLACALAMQPQPNMILSGNRDHFNDAVAAKCGIKICSCPEFINLISEAPEQGS